MLPHLASRTSRPSAVLIPRRTPSVRRTRRRWLVALACAASAGGALVLASVPGRHAAAIAAVGVAAALLVAPPRHRRAAADRLALIAADHPLAGVALLTALFAWANWGLAGLDAPTGYVLIAGALGSVTGALAAGYGGVRGRAPVRWFVRAGAAVLAVVLPPLASGAGVVAAAAAATVLASAGESGFAALRRHDRRYERHALARVAAWLGAYGLLGVVRGWPGFGGAAGSELGEPTRWLWSGCALMLAGYATAEWHGRTRDGDDAALWRRAGPAVGLAAAAIELARMSAPDAGASGFHLVWGVAAGRVGAALYARQRAHVRALRGRRGFGHIRASRLRATASCAG